MSELSGEVWRILDAAANRASEGLRVVEEYARFALNDADVTRQLKVLRHELSNALQSLPEDRRLAGRDTVGDVGTTIQTASEYARKSPLDVVRASLKRTQEALRTLEEYSKLAGANSGELSFPERVEQVRYRSYTLEKSLIQRAMVAQRLEGLNVYLLVTEGLCSSGLEATVRAALSAGIRIIQLREKKLHDRALVERARQLRVWTREAGALFIMNDRPDLAVLADADGVHVGQEELSVCDARGIVGCHRLVGVSTHTIEQARQAVRDGADYIGVGPVFSTSTKQFNALAGLSFVQEAATEIATPWFAIGGIDASNVDSIISAGGRRIAVSGAICASSDPRQAATELLGRINQ